ncbi:MAG TPA: hypothetical protein PKD10_16400, partial [Paracoccaceae bacterium]|nr:hypothetical protein [Paracoccaceae bacterium]
GLNFPRGAFGAARAQGLDLVRDELLRLEGAAPAHLAGRYAPVPGWGLLPDAHDADPS